MCNTCTPILVGVVPPVLEIPLLSKMAKFPFLTMDYSPWSSENLIYWNQLKKFMQIGVHLFFSLFSMSLRNTCMLLNLNNFKILYYCNTAQNLQDKMIEKASRIIHYKIILYRSLCSCLSNCRGVL